MAAGSESSNAWTPKRAALATLVVVGVSGGVLLVCYFHQLFVLLLLAIVLATALKPLAEWLNKRGVRWPFAVGSIFALLALALLSVVVIGGPTVAREATDFLRHMPEKYDQIREQVSSSRIPLLRSASELMPRDLPNPLVTKTDDSETADDEEAALPWQPALEVSSIALEVTLSAAIVCILAAYWLLQEQRTIQALLMLFPRKRREEVRQLIETIDGKLGAYVRGQFVLCLAVGLLSLIGYLLIGLPQAVLLAVIAGLFEAVPMLGPVLGAVPALFVALGSDPTKAVGVIVITLIIQQVENYLLVPRIMDRAVGLHGFVTLLAIAAFGSLFGVLGAVLAIPMAVIVQVVVDRYVLGQDVLEPEKPVGRDRASRLRFELQSLVKDVRMVVRHKSPEAADGNDTLEEAIEELANELDKSLAGDTEPIASNSEEGAEPCAATPS